MLFTCNTTVVAWIINGDLVLSITNTPGVRSVNDTTLGVHISANATTYACGISAGGGVIILSNYATLFLAG